jgi:hypothetical protein
VKKASPLEPLEHKELRHMDTITSHFNLTAKNTAELKGLYCRLFNKLCAPYLNAYEKQQIIVAINQVTAELQCRCIL